MANMITFTANGTTYKVKDAEAHKKIAVLKKMLQYATNVKEIGGWESGYITTSGSTVDITNVTASGSYVHAVVECSEGDVILLTANGAQGARPWCFIDDAGTPLARTTAQALVFEDETLVAPAGTTMLVINNSITRAPDAVSYIGKPLDGSKIATKAQLEDVTGCTPLEYIKGYYIDTSGTTVNPDAAVMSANWSYTKAACAEGDLFAVKGYGGSAGALWAFADADGNILSKAGASDTTSAFIVVTAPIGAALFISNSRHTTIEGGAVKGATAQAKSNASEVKLRPTMGAAYNPGYAHCHVPLGLVNCYGTTQNVHPKVVYIAGGFAGHKWWMAYTPYTNGKTKWENPCVAWSDDGLNWTDLPGNPIDEPQSGESGYFSDTHLVWRPDTGKLECWYRFAQSSPLEEIIYRKVATYSGGTLTWSSRELLHTTGTVTSLSRCLSPAVIWDGTKYKIWYVYYKGKPVNPEDHYIQYCESSDGTNWQNVRQIVLTYTDKNDLAYRLWHIDVELVDGIYYLVAMCKGGHQDDDDPQAGTQVWTLFWAQSADNVSYTTPRPLMYGNPDGWDKYMYRSCVVKVDGVWWLYYSALDEASKHFMAIATGDSIDKLFGTDFFSADAQSLPLIEGLPGETWGPWRGKTIAFFGDSRTWYDGRAYTSTTKADWEGKTCAGYQRVVERELGALVINEGMSGENSVEICTRIQAFDFTGVDAVFLAGGVNDWYNPDGETVEQAKAAWAAAVEYILTNYPATKIYMCVPAIGWNSSSVFPYSTAAIKAEVAEAYNLPCLDLYKLGGINELNRAYYYADATHYIHFNDYGNEAIGRLIAGFLATH